MQFIVHSNLYVHVYGNKIIYYIHNLAINYLKILHVNGHLLHVIEYKKRGITRNSKPLR